jgi:UDP-GlcNAc3NAcA epimerase
MKLLSIIGTRPQIIKASAFSKTIEETAEINEILVHTGQHYDRELSELFFDELGISPPKYNLGVGSSSHANQTAEMMIKIEELVEIESPDSLLVYGDTNSTLAGALVAAKSHIPLAHIESGLRSFNKLMPEEINRIVTDRLSDILFCPTEASMENLFKEGVRKEKVHLVGDVMYDACKNYTIIAEERSTIIGEMELNPKEFVLATIHRAENTDNEKVLTAIIDSLENLANNIRVVLPLHPRTKGRIKIRIGSNIDLINPVGYLDMIELERNSKAIITDSGGVQKEAFFHRVPCITIRSETEWVELVDLGWNKLIDPREIDLLEDRILLAVTNSSSGKDEVDLYGGGNASEMIRDILVQMGW